jgi:hypothetical protein
MSVKSTWRVSDLLDENQPFSDDVKLARKMLEMMQVVESIDANVRIPQPALEFAENTISEWFEVIADIERSRGNLPYLIDRRLYSNDSPGNPDWDQGMKLEDLKEWFEDEDFSMYYHEGYPIMGIGEFLLQDEPLSGYLNRLFPIKYILRMLACWSMSKAHEAGIDNWSADGVITLNEFRKLSAQTCAYAKEWLVDIDKKAGKGNKGTEVAIGFPEATDKAKDRFCAQFVGSMRKNELTGALYELGFITSTSFMGHLTDEIYFTKEGWAFMQLSNSLMDNGGLGWVDYIKSGKRFSDVEIDFLLEHIKKNLPAEWAFMQEVGALIDAGSNRPKSLEEKIISNHDWEKTKTSQYRNGVLSRMEELELLSRAKDGRQVTYSLTDKGKLHLVK